MDDEVECYMKHKNIDSPLLKQLLLKIYTGFHQETVFLMLYASAQN